MAELRFKAEGPSDRMSYWEFLDRRTASIVAGRKAAVPNPSLAVMLPETSVRPFLAHVLSTPAAAVGIWRIEVIPMITRRFTQPLHVVPSEPIAFTVRLQRRALAGKGPDHDAMLAANNALVQRCMAVGGKIYPPFAPILSPEQWRQHYGAATWRRFSSAKRRFDPNSILTPGAGVFA